MMVQEKLQKLVSIADFLEDDYQKSEILNLKQFVDENRFCLAFLGQFSSGKSCLINALLDRDILPVDPAESTSAVTFVRYGTAEKVVFYYAGGQEEERNFDDLKAYFFRSGNWQGSTDVDSIDVFIDHPLLSTGLILMDTPGVNTINTRHEEITARAIASIGYAVYVLGGALSQSDADFIKRLNTHGLTLLFVRTKIDNINAAEENPAESAEKEKQVIKTLFGSDIEFFPVSNIKENVWYKQVDVLREYLKNRLVNNLEALLLDSVEKKLSLIVERLKEKLSALRESAFQISSREGEAIDENRRLVEKQKREIEQHINHKIEKINLEITDRLSSAKQEAKELAKTAYKAYLQKFSTGINTEGQGFLKAQLQNELENFAGSLQDFLRNELDAVLKETGQGIVEESGKFSLASESMPVDISDVLFKSYEDFASNLTMSNATIENADSGIEESDAKIQQMELLLRQAQSRYEEEQAEYAGLAQIKDAAENELNVFTGTDHGPMYNIVEPDKSKTEVLKTLGRIADIATFFIPGKAIGSVASKAITGTAKALKVGAEGAKVAAQIGARVVKIATAADRGKDLLYGGKVVKDAVSQDNKGGFLKILDMLTFEHWFVEIGKHFEEPPLRVFDTEKANRIAAEEYRLRQKYEEEVKREVEKKQELRLIKTRQEELEAQSIAEQHHLQTLARKKTEAEKRIAEETEKQYRAYLKRTYTDTFHAQSVMVTELLLNKFDGDSKNIPAILMPYYTEALVREVERIENKLSELAKDKEKCAAVLKACDEYLAELKDLKTK